jgi:sulfide:quinone oxidoreductase
MKQRIVILGAGFAGLELATLLSDAAADRVEITLIDEAEGFIFGFSKLDVMFGRTTLDAVRLPYREIVKPGVTVKRERVVAIDAAAKRVTTDADTHQADVLVIALGADYDAAATPGIELGVNEFYTPQGAAHFRDVLPKFTKGHAVVGVCWAPYKCPPAPSECALMLHDHLEQRGVRGDCTITYVNPLSAPVPPSPETSQALIAAFAERGIVYMPGHRIVSVDPARKVVTINQGRELPCDLFLGVPKNVAAKVVVDAGLTEDGWVPVDHATLETRFPGVYALGDLASTGAPKAGVFAEGTAKTVAANLLAVMNGKEPTAKNTGAASCYIEFGADRIARVDVDFLSGPKPTGTFYPPSAELRLDKERFSATRRARWFGLA